MTGASLLRTLAPEEVVCPAGSLVGDAGCRCNIEQATIDGRSNPSTLEAWCMSDYASCPSWQAMKKAEEAGHDLRKLVSGMQSEAARKRAAKALREARLRKVQRLLHEDSPQGRAFRRKLRVGEFDRAQRIAGAD